MKIIILIIVVDGNTLPSGRVQKTPGKQEYFNEPMDGLTFIPWLEQFIIDNKIVVTRPSIHG